MCCGSRATLVGVLVAFLVGVASLGLYTYLPPMAETQGLTEWGFALIRAWGIGGVTGYALVGAPLDRHGPTPLLVLLPILLIAAFATVRLSPPPIVWLTARPCGALPAG